MHLYLGENPRTLYVVTSSQEEQQGRSSRALVFRAAEAKTSQAVVEFLPKDEVDLSNAVKLSNRIIKGCLGLISIAGGTSCSKYRRLCPNHYAQTYSLPSLHPQLRLVTSGRLLRELNLWQKYMKLPSTA